QSRSLSARLTECDRDGGCVWEIVGEVLGSDETEAEGSLEGGGRLRRVTAFGAGSDVGRGGGSEAQPAAWAAGVGHVLGSRSVLPRQSVPHTGHTRFITGLSARSSVSSKYTRWRPRPDTRRACPHFGQL